jgi:hypothetical protein
MARRVECSSDRRQCRIVGKGMRRRFVDPATLAADAAPSVNVIASGRDLRP